MKDSLITVFTKPWAAPLTTAQVADLVATIGFGGVEFPVREGFQVEPENIGSELVLAAKTMEERGLKMYSVATELSEEALRACGDAGVSVLRTMLPLDGSLSYMENVEVFRRRCGELLPVAEKSGVSIGLQNHCDGFACSALSIMHAIEPFDSDGVSAVLDLGHTGLEGEREDIAIDICWPRLSMINLKNGIRFKDGEEDDGTVRWNRTWVPGNEGFTSWGLVVSELLKRDYSKPICITAEYKDGNGEMLKGYEIVPQLQRDLSYLKHLVDELG